MLCGTPEPVDGLTLRGSIFIPESPLDCKIKPVNLKEINPEYSLEGLILKLLMGRAESLGKTLILGKIEGRRRG